MGVLARGAKSDIENIYFKPGFSLLQMCFEALGFPINPIGKTIEVLIYRTGVKFDEVGYTFDDLTARSYETAVDYMGTIVTAKAWIAKKLPEEHVCLSLYMTQKGSADDRKLELSNLYWLFVVKRPEMTLEPVREMKWNDKNIETLPRFSDHRITVDNLLDNIISKTVVVVRVLG